MRTKSTFSRMIGTALAMLLILAGSLSASAQGQLKVTGKVTDELNAPMVGVSVIEKGTQNGVITDGDGAYEITVKAGAVLEVSYIGYLTVDRNAINGTLNINMEPDNEMLEETVVVGYGVQKKSSLTGSVTQVKSEDITGRTINNPAQALQGKTSGVQVFTTTHNTDLMSNDLLRPDCYFLLENNSIKAISELTEKELRQAHNLQKMYKAGAFNGR